MVIGIGSGAPQEFVEWVAAPARPEIARSGRPQNWKTAACAAAYQSAGRKIYSQGTHAGGNQPRQRPRGSSGRGRKHRRQAWFNRASNSLGRSSHWTWRTPNSFGTCMSHAFSSIARKRLEHAPIRRRSTRFVECSMRIAAAFSAGGEDWNTTTRHSISTGRGRPTAADDAKRH